VNARAHALGRRRTILNPALAQEWNALLGVLCCTKQPLGDAACLEVSYYLLLQDRIEDGQKFFARVDASKVTTRIQVDYMQAYLDLYTTDHKLARGIASKYKDHPVDRWRKRFQDVLSKLDEAEGAMAAVSDAESREQQQARLAATEPAFDFAVEQKRVTIEYQNLAECRVSYYLMDVELLFSRSPFAQQRGAEFNVVRPQRTEVVRFPEGRSSFAFDLPAELASSNVLVEVTAAGKQKSVAYLAHSLALRVAEGYGQLRVTRQGTGAPLAAAYVKVYARMKDGTERFYKDGYTDIRGAFDYTSLSTGELGAVDRFAVLVLSDTDGALIAEAGPPKM
jgi:hypothetical protein